jgi:hypothetical protein
MSQVLAKVMEHAAPLSEGWENNPETWEGTGTSLVNLRPDIGQALAALLHVPQTSVVCRTALAKSIGIILNPFNSGAIFPESCYFRAQLLVGDVVPVCFS